MINYRLSILILITIFTSQGLIAQTKIMSKEKTNEIPGLAGTFPEKVYNLLIKNFNTTEFNRAILHGPPGVGKTELVKKIAKYHGVDLIELGPADIMVEFNGKSARNLKEKFDEAVEKGQQAEKEGKKNCRTILFIDEFQAAKNDPQLRGEYEQVKDQLVLLLDHYRNNKYVFFIGATNRYDLIAMNVKDRFGGNVFEFGYPNSENRRACVRKFCSNLSLLELSAPKEQEKKEVSGDAKDPKDTVSKDSTAAAASESTHKIDRITSESIEYIVVNSEGIDIRSLEIFLYELSLDYPKDIMPFEAIKNKFHIMKSNKNASIIQDKKKENLQRDEDELRRLQLAHFKREEKNTIRNDQTATIVAVTGAAITGGAVGMAVAEKTIKYYEEKAVEQAAKEVATQMVNEPLKAGSEKMPAFLEASQKTLMMNSGGCLGAIIMGALVYYSRKSEEKNEKN